MTSEDDQTATGTSFLFMLVLRETKFILETIGTLPLIHLSSTQLFSFASSITGLPVQELPFLP